MRGFPFSDKRCAFVYELLRNSSACSGNISSSSHDDFSSSYHLSQVKLAQHLLHGIHFFSSARYFDGDRVDGDVDGLAAKDLGDLQDFGALIHRAGNFEQCHFPSNGTAIRVVMGVDDVDELVQLQNDLM